MPVQNEDHYIHVRIKRDSEEGRKLTLIVSRTLRKMGTEVRLAIRQYKPQAVYKDNGK